MPDQPIDEIPADSVRARLVPRFTIRALLVMITIAAIVFVMIGTAARGQQFWAWGVTIGLVSVIFTALAHAAWFGFVWMFMRLSQSPAPPSESTLRVLMALREPHAASDAGTEMQSSHVDSTQA